MVFGSKMNNNNNLNNDDDDKIIKNKTMKIKICPSLIEIEKKNITKRIIIIIIIIVMKRLMNEIKTNICMLPTGKRKKKDYKS
jgi:hypothetical protein